MQKTELFQQLPIPWAHHAIITDANGQPVDYSYLDCNLAFARLLGIAAQDIIGKRVSVLLPGTKSDPADWIGTYGRLAQNGGSLDFRQFSQSLGLWFRVRAFQTEAGCFATLAEDISAEVQSQQELQLRQRMHSQLSPFSTEVFYHYRFFPESGFSYVSSSVKALTGYTPQDHYNDPRLGEKLVHPDDRHLLKNIHQQPDSLRRELVLRWIHRDGHIIWIEQHNQPRHDESGRIIGIDGIARDITAAKQTEAALQYSQVQMSQILAAVSDVVLYYNSDDMTIGWANQAAERAAGVDFGGLIGKYCSTVWGGADAEPCQDCPVRRCFATRQPTSGEHITQWGDTWDVQAYPVHSASGAFVGVVETGHDITRRLQLQKELHKALDLADSANLMKDQFIANMSHELRTPLNGLIGPAELLLLQNLDSDQRSLLEIIRKSGNRLLEEVKKILAFSKLDTAQLSNRRIRFYLRNILKAALEEPRMQAKAKGIDFDLKIDPQLPDWMEGYPGKIRQILHHTADNAVKFTDSGAVGIDVVLVQADPLTLSITITDTGIGVPQEYCSKIFQPFVQVDAGFNRSFEGVGLGLTLALQLVEEMEGSLEISFPESGGTRVTIVLPVHQAVPVTIQEESRINQENDELSKPDDARPAPGTRSLRILLAEDDRINQRVTQAILQSQGHAAIVAENGKDALKILREQNFDLVLMDIQMPVMDGIEATAAIRSGEAGETNHDVPIIAVTAFTDNDERDMCLNAGINGFLAKPVKPAELAQYIQHFADLT